jgi:uncharacterized protein YkwD
LITLPMTFKEFVNQHLWAIALVLGAVSVGAIVWASTTAAPPPVAEQLVPTATASATPSNRATATAPSALIPTKTPTLPPPTNTPTPISVYYEVQPGDVPLAIAAGFSISVDELLEVNNISDPTRLQIGQELLIPVTVTPSPTAPTLTPTPSLTPTPTREPVLYTVESGDSLSKIAAEFEVSTSMLMVANDLSGSDILQVGQKLVIPDGTVEFGAPTVVHEIKAGDTFSYLSFFYGSTIDDILAANPGLEPRSLQLGQKVIIPVTSPPTNPNADPSLPQIIVPGDIPASLADLPAQMINAVNAQRQNAGLAAYQSDPELAKMALAHAQDMVARGYFSHNTPEGITLDDRFEIHNVNASWNGENIQRNVKPLDKTVAEAIRWFMNSAPHRANLLHRRFDKIGIGVAEGPPGWYTFVLVFAQR